MGVIEALLEASAARGLVSQRRVEQALGMPQGRISKWLNGQGEPSWDDVVRWAAHVGVSLDALAGRPVAPPADSHVAYLLDVIADMGLGPRDAARKLLRMREDEQKPAAPTREPREFIVGAEIPGQPTYGEHEAARRAAEAQGRRRKPNGSA